MLVLRIMYTQLMIGWRVCTLPYRFKMMVVQKIVERRVADLSKGTENYIVIENLGKSEVKDFTVTEVKLTNM